MQRDYIATLDWVPAALEAKDKRQFLSRWQNEFAQPSDLLEKFAFLPDTSIVKYLPRFSFALHFRFKLIKPYLSKDERNFYPLENPVRREKVFQTPTVASTTWKGALRAALWQSSYKENHPAIIRLFGNPRESEKGKSGRLYFFPTFFDKKVELEVINPHDRETGVGERGPILIESVPINATGRFTLLYVPFDRIGKDEAETRKQVAEDLTLLAEGLQAMFTLYGFGAKTSSGFGSAEEAVRDGHILTNLLEAVQQAPPPLEPAMPAALQAFLQEFPDEDFSLKPNDWRKQHGATTSQRNRYRNARSEFNAFRQAQENYKAELAEWEAQAAEPVQNFLEAEFATFRELAKDVAKSLAAKLTAGGDA